MNLILANANFSADLGIEKINGPFLYNEGGSPAEYGAGMKLAIERGWLWMHESGTYVKFPRLEPNYSRSLPQR
jgi:hypothetical protein